MTQQAFHTASRSQYLKHSPQNVCPLVVNWQGMVRTCNAGLDIGHDRN